MNIWQSSRVLNMVSSFAIAIGLALVIAASALWVMQRPFFQIKRIDVMPVSGAQFEHVDRGLLKAVLMPADSAGFFRTNLSQVRRQFEAAPWVRHAQVRRIWPNRLVVEIQEHKVLALWDDDRLVNVQGELFSANRAALENESELPEFSGPTGSEADITKRFKELSTWLSPISAKPVAIEVSDRYAWNLILDNGMTVMLGRETGVQMRERIERMVLALPEVTAKLGRVPTHFDLRYPNGFAVKAPALQSGKTTPTTKSEILG